MTTLLRRYFLYALVLFTPLDLYAIDLYCRDLWVGQEGSLSRKRSLESIQTLKLATFNVGKLFGSKGVSDFKKIDRVSHEKALAIADAIDGAAPELILLQEVESEEALEVFVENYLAGGYLATTAESIDPIGGHIAVLMKRDLPFRLQIEEHLSESWTDIDGTKEALFPRNNPIFLVREVANPMLAKPLFALMAVHFASQRGRKGDLASIRWRAEQVKRASSIAKTFLKEYDHEVPLMIAGDFNIDLNKALSDVNGELGPLRDLEMHNAFDLTEMPVDPAARATQMTEYKGNILRTQLDGFLLAATQDDEVVQQVRVHPFLDKHGDPLPLPKSLLERDQGPSDHQLVSMNLRFQKYRSKK